MSEQLDPVSQRIKILIDEFADGVQLRFAKLIGAHQTTIHELFGKRQNKPGLTLLQKIADALPQLRMEWLVSGQGEMLKSDTPGAQVLKNSAYTPRTDAYPVMALSEIKVIELPHVSFKARASFGYMQLQRFKDSDLKGAGIFDTVLFRLPPGKKEEDYHDALVFDIEGDSMEPSLRDGQQVIAWPIPDGKWEYLHNCICVVNYDELVTVKAIFKNELNNRDGLTLHATGGRGGEFTVERKDIHSIWEVREFYGIVPVRLLP
jgi:repressor LexA